MKGDLHARLRVELQRATARGVCTQESLSAVMGKTQTGVGKYMLGKGGALDLDEADAALRHTGSSLAEFLANVPSRKPSSVELLARELETRPQIAALARDLCGVPRSRLSAVIDLARTGIQAATGQRGARSGGSHSESAPVRRTKSAPVKRR